jgi:hypothetical protein
MMPSGNMPTCIGARQRHLLDRSRAVKARARIAGDGSMYTRTHAMLTYEPCSGPL